MAFAATTLFVGVIRTEGLILLCKIKRIAGNNTMVNILCLPVYEDIR